MRDARTASDYEKCTRPYVFDRIEVSASVFVGPRPGDYLMADFHRQQEKAPFCLLGTFYCEFPGGPHLGELASMAAEVCGQGGFFGFKRGRRLPADESA